MFSFFFYVIIKMSNFKFFKIKGERFMKNGMKRISCLFLLMMLLVIALVGCEFTPTTESVYRTVKFDTDGGEEIRNVRVKSGETVEKPVEPKKDGYEFTAWTLDGKTYDFSTVITENITLKATYRAIEYTIEYTLNGGTLIEEAPLAYTVESENFTLPHPEKEGATFIGWTASDDETPKYDYTVAKGSLGNKVFVAHYAIGDYEVSFDTDGAGVVPPVAVKAGEKLTAPEVSKAGHTFLGWYNGETPWNFATDTVNGNITLVAKWQINTYTVTFNTDGGSAVAPVTQNYGTTIVAPSTTKVGYNFLGWYKDGTAFDFANTKLTENITLVAKWEIQTFTVTFNTDGGSAVAPLTQNYGTTVVAPSTTKVGYNFLGWYKDGTAFDFANTKLTENITLVAKWEIITYTISYDLQGGALASPVNTYTVESATFTIPNATKDGYTFLGWTWAGQNTPVFELTIAKGTAKNFELKANFGVDVYTVTLNANGGESLPSVRVEYGKTFTEPVATREGYTFLGWYNGETPWNFESDKVQGNITLVAKWQIKTFTVTFDTNGGSAVAPVTQNYGTLLEKPVITKAGHTFLGWYNGEALWNFESDMLTENVTLVAKWEIHTFTVTFNTDGGSAVAPVTQNYGTAVSAPVTTKVGYNFLGWYRDGVKFDFANTKLTENITLVAKWEIQTFTVTFNTDGGSAVAPVTQNYGTTVSAPSTTKVGYDFLGWYDGETRFDFANTRLTSDINLVAKWKVISYSITYDLDGGFLTDAKTSYTVENETFTLGTPNKSNYDFIGWTWEGQDTPVLTVTVSKGTMGNLHYVAHYKIKTFTVTFVTGGGTVLAPLTLEYGSLVPVPVCEREGYTLSHWTRNGISAWNFATAKVTGDITLTAVWQINSYTVTFVVNGGSAVAPLTQNYGTTIVAPSTTKVGYNFLGWYRDGVKFDFAGTKLTENITLVAKWEIQTFTVTFDTDGGSAVAPLTQNYGTTVVAPSTTKVGYNFLGWYRDGVKFDFANTKLTENITLVAKWKIKTFTVTFDTNGGSAVSSVTQNYGTKLALPECTRDRAVLLGWYNGDVLWNFANDTISSDITLVAKWKIVSATVTYDANGGSAVAPVTQNTDTTLTEPVTTREGYIFRGWYNGETPWNFESDMLLDNITLVAKWEAIEYTISYELGGATLSGAPTKYTIDTETFTLPHPTLAHYAFIGWTYEGQSTPVQNVVIEKGTQGNLAVTANFRVDKYIVSFFTNGGTNVSSITVQYGDKLTAPTVTKDGCELLGWYFGEKLWNFESDIVSSNMTLTAVWNEDTFRITFVMGEEKQVVYTTANAIPVAPVPERYNGMYFVAWDTTVAPAKGNATYTAIYTDIMSVSNMIEMYGYGLTTFANGKNALYASSALYMLALQEHTSPMDGPVRERILEHLRQVVKEGHAPDFDLAPTWDYTSLSAAIALVRDTPTVWKHIDSELEERLDVLMKALAYVESFGTSDYNDYRTGPSMKGNYRKSWNPNYRMASIPPMIYTAYYFGEANMAQGAITLNKMLKAFDEDEYNFMIGKFEEFGWNDALAVWTAEGRVCDDGSSYNGKKGNDAKTALISGGMVICDDTPTATTIWVYGGTGAGVANGGKDYLYGGVGLDNPGGIIEKLIGHNYSGGAVKSDHWYTVDGTYQQVAWILDRSSSPYEGQMGMMLEFASGNRSSTGYCSHDFYLTTIILSSAKALGMYDCAVQNPELFRMVTVGNEDFLYKNEIGYQGYATGSYGTSVKAHSEENESSPYFALKNYWREHMKAQDDATFPILPF